MSDSNKMDDTVLHVALNRVTKEKDELEGKLREVRDGLGWVEAVLHADITDCERIDTLGELVNALRKGE